MRPPPPSTSDQIRDLFKGILPLLRILRKLDLATKAGKAMEVQKAVEAGDIGALRALMAEGVPIPLECLDGETLATAFLWSVLAERLTAKVSYVTGEEDPIEVETRLALAVRPWLPDFILDILARDKNPNVRRCIAQRIDLPVPLLEALAKDDSFLVRARAVQKLQK